MRGGGVEDSTSEAPVSEAAGVLSCSTKAALSQNHCVSTLQVCTHHRLHHWLPMASCSSDMGLSRVHEPAAWTGVLGTFISRNISCIADSSAYMHMHMHRCSRVSTAAQSSEQPAARRATGLQGRTAAPGSALRARARRARPLLKCACRPRRLGCSRCHQAHQAQMRHDRPCMPRPMTKAFAWGGSATAATGGKVRDRAGPGELLSAAALWPWLRCHVSP